MADINDMREGLRARLDTIAGLRTHKQIPGQIVPPVALITLASIVYDSAMGRGLDEYELGVRLYVAPQSDVHAQDRLNDFLASSGAGSVKAAVEGDRTLGGTVQTCRVTRTRGNVPQVFEHGGVEYLGAEVVVQAWASG